MKTKKNVRNMSLEIDDAEVRTAEKIASEIIEHLKWAFEYAKYDYRMKPKNKSRKFNTKIMLPSVLGFRNYFYDEVEEWGVKPDLANPIWLVVLKSIYDTCSAEMPVLRNIVLEFFEWNFQLKHNVFKEYFRKVDEHARSGSTEEPPEIQYEDGVPKMVELRCFRPA